MTKSPAFQFYPQDYLSSARVAEMTLEEEGVYIRLLCYCWASGSIPADPERCARLAGKGCSVSVATSVQRAFNEHPTDTTRLVHNRLEIERENQRIRREQASKAGKRSGESRAKQSKKPAKSHELNGRSTDVQLNANTSSSSSSSDEDEAMPSSSCNNEAGASCSEPSSGSSNPKLGSGIKIPVVGTNSKDYDIPQAKLNEWSQAFPGIDVTAQCRKAAQWCRDNPTKRKTLKGVNRFLNTWLSKEQDSPKLNGQTANGHSKPNGKPRFSDDMLETIKVCTSIPRSEQWQERAERLGPERAAALKKAGGTAALLEAKGNDFTLQSFAAIYDSILSDIRKATNGTPKSN